MLKSPAKHRVVTIFLALVFGVFNIGVPVVLASCPMADFSASPVCSECSDPSAASAEVLVNVSGMSCCATVIVADRNTTEFVQTKDAVKDNVKSQVVHFSAAITHPSIHSLVVVSFSRVTSSPPRQEDISVFTSSLRI